MTSTYGKNRKVVNDGRGGGGVTDALITFDVICDLLLNSPTANTDSICLLYDKKVKMSLM